MQENFTIEDLRNAYEAGQSQANAEWQNDNNCTIGFYNSNAESTFESWYEFWFQEKLKNEKL
jgi:hypothetical protein